MLDNVVVCADDFGLGEGINRGILILTSKAKIQAVSVMIDHSSKFQKDFDTLKSMSRSVQIGLHLELNFFLNKTDILFISTRRKKIREEVLRQIHKFKEIFGFWPKFIDSHKHLHMHPAINDILIEIVTNLGIQNFLYIRNTYSNSMKYFFSPRRTAKKIILDLLGYYAKKKYLKNKIHTNDSFLGVLSYHSDTFSHDFVKSQLKAKKGFALFYTHPAISIDDLAGVDTYLDGRLDEFQVWAEF